MKNWQDAQTYELNYAKGWFADPEHAYPEIVKEFFLDDQALFDEFLTSIEGKRVLELGCGPTPLTLDWPCQRIIVEPLFDNYRDKIAVPPEVEVLTGRGEDVLPCFTGQIDGAIVSRNCFDHSDTPFDLLTAFLACASPGATLLMWCDIWHYPHADVGHGNMIESRASMRSLVSVNFDILREVYVRPPIPDPPPEVYNLDWGCVARKRACP